MNASPSNPIPEYSQKNDPQQCTSDRGLWHHFPDAVKKCTLYEPIHSSIKIVMNLKMYMQVLLYLKWSLLEHFVSVLDVSLSGILPSIIIFIRCFHSMFPSASPWRNSEGQDLLFPTHPCFAW